MRVVILLNVKLKLFLLAGKLIHKQEFYGLQLCTEKKGI